MYMCSLMIIFPCTYHTISYNITQNLKDLKLALGIAVLVLIDILILVVYTIVEGLSGGLKATLVQNEENSSSEFGVSINRF